MANAGARTYNGSLVGSATWSGVRGEAKTFSFYMSNVEQKLCSFQGFLQGTYNWRMQCKWAYWENERCTVGADRKSSVCFLPRDASAERCDEIAFVCPSDRPSVTIRYHEHRGWNTSKIISWPNSLGSLCWLTPNIGDLVQPEHPQN